MLSFEKCEKLFLDFDGVIVDSNKFKEIAIEKSIFKVLGENQKNRNAVKFFNINAGIAREKKLSTFFESDEVYKIMKTYSEQCQKFFLEAPPTTCLDQFLLLIKEKHKSTKIYILSGGEKEEIYLFLKKNSLIQFFEDILASDKNKIEHLLEKHVSKNDIFIGDSQNDLKASKEAGLKFILFGQFKSLESFPSKKLINENNLYKTENFETLIKESQL